MDCIKITLLLLFFGTSVQAQTLAEWFNQKKTQKKYLLQQIAALQVYSGYLKNGYQIAKGGLGNIGARVQEEYGLHRNYYNQLRTVNAIVKNDPQARAILRWQQDILTQTAAIRSQSGLSNAERDYAGRVCQALLRDCEAQINDLQTVMTDNKAEMSDEERLRQLARLYAAMQDNYRFVAGFRGQLQLYAGRKPQEINDIKTIRRLYAHD